ncbi:MAG: hydrogenobyrinic acid a,c-diamide synthase (glutamine-hydrolyzing) [Chloroflexi bacterium]|nr:hydrogenobyrinic acid a,c-diamide synthase (glutamine-hydrolyzing) [Chloroflexota bacterium]
MVNQMALSVTIAAPQGRSGKTTVSLGLCAALRRCGLVVQPFKKGPDYIDPSWLTATGRSCRNLDAVLMSEGTLLASFQHACEGASFALIEGAMGLYDGFDSGGWGSTSHIAKLVGSPIILVVNAARMTRSVAAMVSGYQHFEPDSNIRGVVLNNVASSQHKQKLVRAIEQYCQIPVVGCIPRDPTLSITERHLGLTPFREIGKEESIDRIAHQFESYLDTDTVLAIASEAQTSHTPDIAPMEGKPVVGGVPSVLGRRARVGVMLDRAFTFYYPENLEALTQAGAELVLIDSMHHQTLPDIDGLYIGGGFPEVFAEELEANSRLRQDIRRAIEDDLPVYAECAGLMYLCRAIQWHDRWYEMVGAIPAEVEMRPKIQGHGYTRVEVARQNPFFSVGQSFWGHEFHHSTISPSGTLNFAYRMLRGRGIDGKADGIVYKNVLACYTHLHALGVPQWAEAFVALAAKKQHSLVTLPT